MDAINIMAYDVYWEGYDWKMDVSALEELGVPRVIRYLCNCIYAQAEPIMKISFYDQHFVLLYYICSQK